MPNLPYLPHIDLLLAAMRIQRERLESKSKIAIDARLLRALIKAAVEQQPFSEAFYCETYPDIASAHESGKVPNLREHFVATGYFEGRVGAPPEIDEAYYVTTYPDVARGLKNGDVASAAEHYVRSGAAEGRVPHPAIKPEIDGWMALLREPPLR